MENSLQQAKGNVVKNDCKEAAKTCFSSTSVRGIPRVLSARSTTLRALWILSTIAGFTTAVYLLVRILTLFLKYETFTNIKVCSNCTPDFPDVTVCYLNILNGIKDLDQTSYSQYKNRLSAIAGEFNASQLSEAEREYLEELYSVSAFYGNTDIKSVSDQLVTVAGNTALVHDCTW